MNGDGSNSQKNVIYFDLKSSENENPVFENVAISKLGGGAVETHAGLITDNYLIELNFDVTDDLTLADDIEVQAYLNADGVRQPLSKNAEGKFTVDTSGLGGLEVLIDLEATDSEGGRGTSTYSLGVIEANTLPVLPTFEITADQGVPALIFDGKYRDVNINLEVRFNGLPTDDRDGELSYSQIEVAYGVADDMRTAVVDENGVAVLEGIDAFAGKEMTIRRVIADLDGLETSLSDPYGIHKDTPAYFADEGDFDGAIVKCCVWH
jgi:hypothetical protein